jgi:pimeloyl-ACP methyl ester carboxylesterase
MGIGNVFALGVERIIEPVEGMHFVIARRWFDAMGPFGRRAKGPYETMTRLAYGSVRLGAATVGAALDRVVPVEDSTFGVVQSWANGLFGDGLGRHETRLATSMEARHRDDSDLTGRLVVLVHGLGRTENCWDGNEKGPGLAQTLAANPRMTPVPIRYNTGLRVADNGAQLGDLLEELVSGWPVPVESIALVGHSMGGLVIAEALASARSDGQLWVEHVSAVVAIATPYRGAPLEKLVVAAAWGLGIAKTTRPLAGFLDGRSRGIKDLGFTKRKWKELVPSLVRHHVIAGVATSDPRHLMGLVIGDLMVRPASSTSPRDFRPDSTVVLGGVTHFDLLHSPDVIEQVMGWLAPEKQG